MGQMLSKTPGQLAEATVCSVAERDAEARLLATYQLSCFVLGASFCAVFAVFSAWWSLLGPTLFLGFLVVSTVARRAGSVAVASKVLCFALWVAPTWCACVSGGIYSPLVLWFTPHTLWRRLFWGGVGRLPQGRFPQALLLPCLQLSTCGPPLTSLSQAYHWRGSRCFARCRRWC